MDTKLEIVLTAREITGKAFSAVEKQCRSLSSHVFSLNGVITTLAGAGFGYLVQQSMEATAELQKNAAMAGVSLKAYQELTYAASQYMVTQEALTDGLKELNLRAEEFAVTGSGPGKEAFERLGYSQAQLKEKLKDTPALLSEIINKMQGMENASKMRIADEIFGGQGGEQFTGMINGGSQAIENFTKRAHELGLVLTDEAAQGAMAANRAVDTLTKQIQTQFTSVVAGLAPEIEGVVIQMSHWVGQNKTFLSQDVPGHIESMAGKVKEFVNSTEFDLMKEYWELAAGAAIGFKFGGGAGAIIGAGVGGFYSAYKDLKKLTSDQIKEVKLLEAEYEVLGRQIKSLDGTVLAKPEEIQALKDRRIEIEKQIQSLLETEKQSGKTAAVTKDLSTAVSDMGNVTEHATKNLNILSKEAKTARESLAAIGVDSALADFFKDIDKYEDKLKFLADQAKNARESLAAIGVDSALADFFDFGPDLEYTLKSVDTGLGDFFDDIDDTVDDLQKERTRKDKEAMDKRDKLVKDSLAKQERAYENLFQTVQGYTADIIEDMDNAGDTLVTIAKRTATEMAAAFLAEKLIMPVALDIGSALGLSWQGTSFADMAGGAAAGGGFGFGNVLSAGQSLWGAYSGTTSNMAYNVLSQVPGMGFGGAISTGALAAGGELGWGAGAMASIGTGTGAGGLAAGLATVAPYLGLVAMAIPLITKLFKDDPDPYIGMQSGHFDQENYGQGSFNSKKFNFLTFAQDMGPDMSMAFRDYFDDRFTLVDDALNGAFKTTLEKYSVNGPNNGWIDAEGKNAETLMKEVSDNVFGSIFEGLKKETIGEGFGAYDLDFFKSIKNDTDDLFEAFVKFNSVVKMTDNYVEKSARQMADFGESAVSAYQNLKTISGIMSTIDAGMLSITDTTFTTTMAGLANTWANLIDVLTEANSITEELTQAKQAENLAYGVQLTGLTANSLVNIITGGGDITGTLKTNVANGLAATLAGTLMADTIQDMNEAAGKIYAADGMEAAAEYIAGFDLTDVIGQIKDFSDTINGLFGGAAIEDRLKIAKENYISAMDREIETIQAEIASNSALIDENETLLASFKNLSENIKEFQQNLLFSGDIADPQTRLDSIRNQLESTVQGLFSSDNATVQKALADLPGMSDKFLEVSREANTDFQEYQNDFGYVMGILNTSKDIAQVNINQTDSMLLALYSQNGVLESQIAYFEQEIILLTDINTNIISLADAKTAYESAKTAPGAVGGDGGGSGGAGVSNYSAGGEWMGGGPFNTSSAGVYMQKNPDVLEAYQKSGLPIGPYYQRDFANQHYILHGKGEGRPLGFATGGTISGPSSGYTLPPDTEFHGIEHFTPDSQMAGVKDELVRIWQLLFTMVNLAGDNKELFQDMITIFKRNMEGGTDFKISSSSTAPLITKDYAA